MDRVSKPDHLTFDPTEKININYRTKIEHEGVQWNLSITDLASGCGFSTQLTDEENHRANFYLDYPDVFADPTQARIHMMPGANKQVSFGEKLTRMELWAKAIGTFNSMMTQEGGHPISKADIEKMLTVPQLPRIETAIGDTGNESLIKLFKGFKYVQKEEKPNPFVIPWSDLVEKARSGELVKAWRVSKGR